MKKYLNSTLLLFALLLAHFPVAANAAINPKQLVNASLASLSNFAIDPNMQAFQQQLARAKGFLIVPRLIKAGFILGGAGGTGVLLRKDNDQSQRDIAAMDQWSHPAFYNVGSVTFGLQIGGEVAEIIMVFMTDKGLDALLSTSLQFGADASIAAGPVGTGTQAATADVVIYSRSKGAFGGLTLEGAVITANDSLNSTYYGKKTSPLEILVTDKVENAHAMDLREKLSSLSSY